MKLSTRSIRLGLFFALLCLPQLAPAARVAEQIIPQVAQQGTETTVVVIGHQLETVTGLLPFSPGIAFVRTKPTGDEKIVHVHPNHQGPGKSIYLTLTIAKDAAIGEHLFRLVTTKGLSELLTIWVTPFPCVREAEPANAARDTRLDATRFEQAQRVDIGTTVWGHFPGHSNFDQDLYAVNLQKGDSLRVEFWGSCLSNPIDAGVTIFGPDHSERASSDDTILRERDPLLAYVARQDGTHYVAAHPFNDDENGTWHYAMSLSLGPRPTLTYPLGGPAGSELKATLLGDPAGPIEQSIALPKDVGSYEAAIIDHYLENSTIPLHIKVAAFANVLEDGGDHSTPTLAQVHGGTLPIAFNGKIESEGEVDWFRFTARKGARYVVHTYAAAMGSPLDPAIQIRPAEDTESSLSIEADDSTWQDRDLAPQGRWRAKELVDPVVVFEADADGDYLLGVSDNQRLSSPDHIYRVEFQPAHDRLWLQTTHDYRESPEKRDRIDIHAGSSIERTFKLIAPPATRYAGAFDILFRGLPKGVTATAPQVTKASRIVQITFSAAPGTPPWAGFPEIEFRPAEPGVTLAGGYFLLHTRTIGRGGLCSGFYRKSRRFPLSVIAPAPLDIRVTPPNAGLALDAFLDLDIELDRSGGWAGDVVVRCLWTPPDITASPPITIPAGQTKASFRLTASGRATPGPYRLCLTAHEAHSKVNGANISTGLGLHHVSSTPVTYEVVAPFLKIDLARSAIERGKQGTITGTVTHISPLPGKATATLINLPTGVELLGNPTITTDTQDIEFSIRATEAALLGQAGDIACLVTILQDGQQVVQSAGVATIRIDAERK